MTDRDALRRRHDDLVRATADELDRLAAEADPQSTAAVAWRAQAQRLREYDESVELFPSIRHPVVT